MIRFCAILTILLVLTAGCKTTDEHLYQLTMQNSGQTLSLKHGDSLHILLPGNPTTGFDWYEDGKTAPAVLRLTAKKFLSPQYQKELDGAPGKTEFIYKAVGSGETKIQLSYKRPWETVEPARRFFLKILVPRL